MSKVDIRIRGSSHNETLPLIRVNGNGKGKGNMMRCKSTLIVTLVSLWFNVLLAPKHEMVGNYVLTPTRYSKIRL